MLYRFYRSKITSEGLAPTGPLQAELHLDSKGEAHWRIESKEFEHLCLPWFRSPTQWQDGETQQSLEPYSGEALEYLREVKLPSFGFVMREESPKG